MKTKYSVATLCFILTLALVALTMPKPVYGDHRDEEKPIRLRAVAEMGPLGEVFSLGHVALNGKPSIGTQTIWGSELIQAMSENGASIALESLGTVTLKKGAMV